MLPLDLHVTRKLGLVGRSRLRRKGFLDRAHQNRPLRLVAVRKYPDHVRRVMCAQSVPKPIPNQPKRASRANLQVIDSSG